MKIKAINRFNNHNPGELFEADDADAKKWIGNKLAKEASEDKAVDAPPEDKMVKKPGKKK